MGTISKYWTRRPKNRSRRLARDLRVAAPAITIFGCVAMTASVIAATEAVSLQSVDSTPAAIASEEVSIPASRHSSEAGTEGLYVDCDRPDLFDDFDQLDLEDEG